MACAISPRVRRSTSSSTSVLVCLLLGVAAPFAIASAAHAQSTVGDALSSLLLQQRTPATPDLRDQQAAATTRDTLAQLVLVDLSTFPVASSAGGFVYRLNPALGTMERASGNFGPFFTERALRAGADQLSAGVTYRYAEFSHLQGASLTDGTFVSGAARLAGSTQPFDVDTLTLRLRTKTVTGFATYGVSDRLDVSAIVPIIAIDFEGARINTVTGRSTLQSSVFSDATGLGDIALRARYLVTQRASGGGFAVGTDVRLPTGREKDLLGAGKTALRLLSIGSFEGRVFSGHANVGYTFGGVSREFAYGGALAVAPAPRVTLVAELMGRYLNNLHQLRDVYAPHDLGGPIETMRWVPTTQGVNQAASAFGMKWNLTGGYVLNGNVLISLTDSGLTARVVPSLTIDYTFAR